MDNSVFHVNDLKSTPLATEWRRKPLFEAGTGEVILPRAGHPDKRALAPGRSASDGKSYGLAVPEKVFDTFLRAFG